MTSPIASDHAHPRLVLASSSPRRRELLDRLGLEFDVVSPDVDETVLPEEVAADYVERLARSKALAGRDQSPAGSVVVAADTTVVLDGEILGKPTSADDAAAMLARLSARRHFVVTGVAVVTGDSVPHSAMERTEVDVAELTPARIGWYVGTGEGSDKAGGYGLQGAAALFVDRIHGSVSNVVGLPLPLLDRLCADSGHDLTSFGAPR